MTKSLEVHVPHLFSFNVFARSLDIDFQSCSGFFGEAWVFLPNDILFLWQNPANHLSDILKVPTCSGFVLLMIHFACFISQSLDPLSLLVPINLLYNSFSITGNTTFPWRVDRDVRFCFFISSSLLTQFLISFLSTLNTLEAWLTFLQLL